LIQFLHLWNDCYISQDTQSHSKQENGSMYAWDISCRARYFDVYAPWTWEYLIEVHKHHALWNYVILKQWKRSYVLAHVKYYWVLPYKVKWWEKIWQIDISWITTWPHLHYEERIWNENIRYIEWGKIEYNPKSVNLRAYRWRDYQVYFTNYDLWDVKQNDTTPCIWASWKDLCELHKNWTTTIALTADMRKVLWVKFWDKVILKSQEWNRFEAVVHDEMNKRYREWCIKKKSTDICIKWDIARFNWVADIPQWAYTVIAYK